MNFYYKVDEYLLIDNRVKASYVFEYLLNGETPGRKLSDIAIKKALRLLENPGIILELGGVGDYYRKMTNQKNYIVSNIITPCDLCADMTSLPLKSESVDAIFSAFALEHVYEYEKALLEMLRVLKIGGRAVLAVPFMYYMHGEPNDYFRWTSFALKKFFLKYGKAIVKSFGSRLLIIAQFYHEKKVLGHKGPLRMFFKRIAVAPILFFGLMGNQSQEKYALTHVLIFEKSI